MATAATLVQGGLDRGPCVGYAFYDFNLGAMLGCCIETALITVCKAHPECRSQTGINKDHYFSYALFLFLF